MQGFQVIQPELVSHKPLQRMYRLRWRFAFHDRNDRAGVWDDCAPSSPVNSAWGVNKTGLVMAFIDTESLIDYEMKTVVECQAQDFAIFQWRFISNVNFNAYGGVQTPLPAGLQMLTRDKKITVYVDGKTEIVELNDDEKGFHFKEFKAGSLLV